MATALAQRLERMITGVPGATLRAGLAAVELRLGSCRASTGPRAFVKNSLPAIKFANPGVAIKVLAADAGGPSSITLLWNEGASGDTEVAVAGQTEDVVLASLLAAAGDAA